MFYEGHQDLTRNRDCRKTYNEQFSVIEDDADPRDSTLARVCVGSLLLGRRDGLDDLLAVRVTEQLDKGSNRLAPLRRVVDRDEIWTGDRCARGRTRPLSQDFRLDRFCQEEVPAVVRALPRLGALVAALTPGIVNARFRLVLARAGAVLRRSGRGPLRTGRVRSSLPLDSHKIQIQRSGHGSETFSLAVHSEGVAGLWVKWEQVSNFNPRRFFSSICFVCG